jgi:hypothetical protein
MTFVVLGFAIMLVYAVMAARTAVVARRDPCRSFQVGRDGHARRREVTAEEWIRRHVPWGLGGGLLVTFLGLFLVARGRQ